MFVLRFGCCCLCALHYQACVGCHPLFFFVHNKIYIFKQNCPYVLIMYNRSTLHQHQQPQSFTLQTLIGPNTRHADILDTCTLHQHHKHKQCNTLALESQKLFALTYETAYIKPHYHTTHTTPNITTHLILLMVTLLFFLITTSKWCRQ